MLFILSKINAQNSHISVLYSDKNIGKNLLTNEEIIGREYLFPESIKSFDIDSNTFTAIVKLRGYNGKTPKAIGNGVVYNFNKQNVNFYKPLHYLTDESMSLIDSQILYNNSFKTFKLNAIDGKEIWSIKNHFFYINQSNKIALGYKRSSFDGSLVNKLEATDLSNGKIIWEKPISVDLGWSGINTIDDSTVFITSDGFNQLNLKTGGGWKFASGTEYVDNSGKLLTNSLGVLSGLLTGSFFFSTGKNVVSNMCSNLLIDSSTYYVATKYSIDKLDGNGKTLWFNSLPFDKCSKSTLTKENENLFLLNEGYAFLNGRTIPIGEPYFGSYNTHDGKENFLTTLSNDKKAMVSSSLLKDSCLYACLGNQLIACSKQNGRIIKSIELGEKEKKFPVIIGNQVYYQTTDSSYQCYNKIFSETLNVYDGKNSVLSLNKNLEVISSLDESKLWTKAYNNSAINILYNNGKSIILNNKNKKLMQFDHEIQIQKVKGEIFIVDDKKIIRIPSSTLD